MNRQNDERKRKFLQSLKKIEPGRYDSPWWKMMAIIENREDAPFSIAADAFSFGFMQGQKAARAAKKITKRRRENLTKPDIFCVRMASPHTSKDLTPYERF